MKKAIIVLLAFCGLLASPSANAQTVHANYPNEISFSYGVSLIGSAMSTLVNTFGLFNDIVGDEDMTVRSGGSRGILNLGYIHHTNRIVGFGANAGFNRMSVNLEDSTGKITAASANLFFLMADAKFNWFRRPMFGMYSKLGLGAMCINGSLVEDVSGSLWLPTMHVSVIGMEIGERFCGFAELGAGMQGIAQFGVKYHF